MNNKLIDVLVALGPQLSCQNPNHPYGCLHGEECEFYGVGKILESKGAMHDCFEIINQLRDVNSSSKTQD